MFIVVQKLKAVKAALKKWNTQVFGRTNERVIRKRHRGIRKKIELKQMPPLNQGGLITFGPIRCKLSRLLPISL